MCCLAGMLDVDLLNDEIGNGFVRESVHTEYPARERPRLYLSLVGQHRTIKQVVVCFTTMCLLTDSKGDEVRQGATFKNNSS
jgi:hypothetical protein